MDAAEAYASVPVALPVPPDLPDAPGVPPSLDTGTAPPDGVVPAALEFLAAQTAREAHRLLREALHGASPAAGLTPAQDAVRLAAADPSDPGVRARLAEGRVDLGLAVRAWREGGASALAVLDEEWSPDSATSARARAVLEAAWDADERPALRAHANRWTAVGEPAQIRLDREGRWWPYRRLDGRWTPVGGPALDPATALAAATGSEEDPW